MATELHVRIRQNPYHGHEAVFWLDWKLHRYSFESNDELAYQLVRDRIHPEVRDEVMLSAENYEWDRTYPLGVVYVGEAVCDCSPETVTSRTAIFGAFPHKTPEKPASNTDVKSSRFWDWLAAALRIGAVTAPWVLLVIGVRVAWAKAVAWGWV